MSAGGLMAPVFVMLREHAQIWATLDSLEHEVDTDAAEHTTRGLCHQLTVRLQHHNLKEERVLYPQADQRLTTQAATQLRAFLDTGELPGGWVCQKARA